MNNPLGVSPSKGLLYKAYILPYFTCCSTVWMHCGKTAAGKLEKLIKRALMRCIFKDNISTYMTMYRNYFLYRQCVR